MSRCSRWLLLVLVVFIHGCADGTAKAPLSLEDAIDQVAQEMPDDVRDEGDSDQIDRTVREKKLDGQFQARGADCREFLNREGVPGAYGHAILDAFDRYDHFQVLLEHKAAKAHSMPQLCPGFARFSRTERAYFWIWVFAAISWDESTCKPGAHNRRAVNSAAVGLLQLEAPQRLRYWRGPLCKGPSVSGAKANLGCGMEIMRGQFEGTYSGGRCGGIAGLSMPCSYWEKLRRNWSNIHRLITLYPGCNRR